MTIFTYEELEANKLSSELKSDGNVSVKLSKKRAVIAFQFFGVASKLMGHDGKTHSFLSSMVSLFMSLLLLMRVACFHRRLFQIFIYYIHNQPDYSIKEEMLIFIKKT